MAEKAEETVYYEIIKHNSANDGFIMTACVKCCLTCGKAVAGMGGPGKALCAVCAGKIMNREVQL